MKREKIGRREFLVKASATGMSLPIVAGGARPLLEPLFRKEPTPRPTVETPVEVWNDAFAAVFDTLERNLQSKTGLLRSEWTRPSPRYFETVLWDACFAAQVWSLWKPDVACAVLDPFLSKQSDDGRIPGSVDITRSSSGINPPLLAWAIEKIGGTHSNSSYMKDALAKLEMYHRWLRKERLKDGMYYYSDLSETFMEDSPRFLVRKGGTSRIRDMERFLPIDLNSLVVLQLRSMASIAESLGRKQESGRYIKEAAALAARINRYMWDDKRGLYFDTYEKNKSAVPTIVSFYPLIAGGPDRAQAEALVAELKNRESFWTDMPFPSVSKGSDHFQLESWQGPVWIGATYLVIQGLERYGYGDLACAAARRVVGSVYGVWGEKKSFYEFYNPLTGDTKSLRRSLGFPRNLIMGSSPLSGYVGSTGVVNNLLMEYILGIRWKNSKPRFEPALPVSWKGHVVKYQSPFLKFSCTLTLEEEDRVRVRVESPSSDEMTVPNRVLPE